MSLPLELEILKYAASLSGGSGLYWKPIQEQVKIGGLSVSSKDLVLTQEGYMTKRKRRVVFNQASQSYRSLEYKTRTAYQIPLKAGPSLKAQGLERAPLTVR